MALPEPGSRVVVIDFGSQTTQLIARRIREHGVYSEIFPFDAAESDFESFGAQGYVLSGGPETVTSELTPRIPDCVLESGLPILGICYGMQALVHQLGGEVEGSSSREFGSAHIHVSTYDPILGPSRSDHEVWMSHGDRVLSLPEGFEVTATTPDCPIAGLRNQEEKIFGIQFHPEVTHTLHGSEMLRRFALDVCGCEADWRPDAVAENLIQQIRKTVGKERVLLGLSGGVDSSVVAALVSRAIGDQLTCLLVDHGLMRQNEVHDIESAFSRTNALTLDLRVVEAGDEFFAAIEGIDDPELKRKAIGRTFVDVFQREASKLSDIAWLAQGTIYPDVVESAATRFGKSHVIKSHHNVGGLPETLNLKLLEPLRDLFKDEVRKVGTALGLPSELIDRQPFPGPGLAVRILGNVERRFVSILQAADAIYLDELERANLLSEIDQAFAVFLPVKSVAVVGDTRAYEYVIALRAVATTDFMTADWFHIPHEVLSRISTRVINEIPQVSRVVYDISTKPPATIEWE